MVMPIYLDNSLHSQGIISESTPTTKQLLSKYVGQLTSEFNANNKVYLGEKIYLERQINDLLAPSL